MNPEKALDALINLAIAYIILSIVASSMVELVSQLLRIRGRILGSTVRGLLGDSTRAFYELPTITGLRQTGSVRTWLRWPFGLAAFLLPKTWRPAWGRKTLGLKSDADHTVDFIDPATFADSLQTLDRQEKLPRSLTGENAPFRYNGGELQLDQVKRWFEQAMRATKRQYRRTAQLALLILGVLMAAGVQLDTLKVLRVAFAADSDPEVPAAFGFLMTGAAVALGSQYWFDMVGRLVGLRTKLVASGMWGRAARRP